MFSRFRTRGLNAQQPFYQHQQLERPLEWLILTILRQACSSHHQIVIWICFWYLTNSTILQIVRRQCCLTILHLLREAQQKPLALKSNAANKSGLLDIFVLHNSLRWKQQCCYHVMTNVYSSSLSRMPRIQTAVVNNMWIRSARSSLRHSATTLQIQQPTCQILRMYDGL